MAVMPVIAFVSAVIWSAWGAAQEEQVTLAKAMSVSGY
jgi:hypothetical protein